MTQAEEMVDGKEGLKLSEEEKDWIRKNPFVVLGADRNWPPFEFQDNLGLPSGLSYDLVKLIEGKTGLEISVVSDDWYKIIELFNSGELDGMSCIFETQETKSFLNHTVPYYRSPAGIIVREGRDDIDSAVDFTGKTLAIQKDSGLHEYSERMFADSKLILLNSEEDVMLAVAYGHADAGLCHVSVYNHFYYKDLLTGIKMVNQIPGYYSEFTIGIDKNKRVLYSIINKAVKSLSNDEIMRLIKPWADPEKEGLLVLTYNEREWLERHSPIRYASEPEWNPHFFTDNENNPKGILSDYFDLLQEKTDLQFEYVKTRNWSESLAYVKEGKADIINAVAYTDERNDYMLFSNIYYPLDLVIVTRDDEQRFMQLKDFHKGTLGGVKGWGPNEKVRADYPGLIPLVTFPTLAEGLKALSVGQIEGFLVDVGSFEYSASQMGLSNLKVAGSTSYSMDHRIGVRRDEPELQSIMNKAIKLISDSEKMELYRNWISVESDLVDYSLIKRILALFLIASFIFFLWVRRLRQEVRLREEAEEKALHASKAKGDFLAFMSHEIRTPLQGILGYTELLRSQITEGQEAEFIKGIVSCSKSLLSIINDVLDYSKIEAGKIDIHLEPLDIQSLFLDLESLFRPQTLEKGLYFKLVIQQDLPSCINFDGQHLRQIMINLLGNAVKFTEKGGITLQADYSKGKGNWGELRVIVQDTGMGISEENKEMIFNSYAQPAGQNEEKYGGTGLGLSITRMLTDLLGGSLSLESSLGKGSSFMLCFPQVGWF